jgi:hypothetical protein
MHQASRLALRLFAPIVLSGIVITVPRIAVSQVPENHCGVRPPVPPAEERAPANTVSAVGDDPEANRRLPRSLLLTHSGHRLI